MTDGASRHEDLPNIVLFSFFFATLGFLPLSGKAYELKARAAHCRMANAIINTDSIAVARNSRSRTCVCNCRQLVCVDQIVLPLPWHQSRSVGVFLRSGVDSNFERGL